MESVNAVEDSAHKRSGILYPVMVIAAITLIVFSVVGIATMMGWMPSATSGSEQGMKSGAAPAEKSGARFQAGGDARTAGVVAGAGAAVGSRVSAAGLANGKAHAKP